MPSGRVNTACPEIDGPPDAGLGPGTPDPNRRATLRAAAFAFGSA